MKTGFNLTKQSKKNHQVVDKNSIFFSRRLFPPHMVIKKIWISLPSLGKQFTFQHFISLKAWDVFCVFVSFHTFAFFFFFFLLKSILLLVSCEPWALLFFFVWSLPFTVHNHPKTIIIFEIGLFFSFCSLFFWLSSFGGIWLKTCLIIAYIYQSLLKHLNAKRLKPLSHRLCVFSIGPIFTFTFLLFSYILV